VLLRKPTEGAKQTKVDYLGFDIPDAFVVGYGLDYNDHYRNLPDIVTLKPHVLQGKTNA
jgi:hypoxanthine phosphoribosyltransferase